MQLRELARIGDHVCAEPPIAFAVVHEQKRRSNTHSAIIELGRHPRQESTDSPGRTNLEPKDSLAVTVDVRADDLAHSHVVDAARGAIEPCQRPAGHLAPAESPLQLRLAHLRAPPDVAILRLLVQLVPRSPARAFAATAQPTAAA